MNWWNHVSSVPRPQTVVQWAEETTVTLEKGEQLSTVPFSVFVLLSSFFPPPPLSLPLCFPAHFSHLVPTRQQLLARDWLRGKQGEGQAGLLWYFSSPSSLWVSVAESTRESQTRSRCGAKFTAIILATTIFLCPCNVRHIGIIWTGKVFWAVFHRGEGIKALSHFLFPFLSSPLFSPPVACSFQFRWLNEALPLSSLSRPPLLTDHVASSRTPSQCLWRMSPGTRSYHAGGATEIFQQRGAAWALCTSGGGSLLRAALRGADHLQAPHPPGTPVLQEPPGWDEEVHTAVQR